MNENLNRINNELPQVNVRRLLRKHGIKPKKGLGQNFLQDENHLSKIVSIATISNSDTVLDIGPGLGNLTRHLASQAFHVVAVELDNNIIPILKEVMVPFKNVKFVNGDILKLNISELMANSSYIVVANIPYYITSYLVRHLLETTTKPDRIILTVQHEVALRMCSEPPSMNRLALSIQVYGEPSIRARIPAGAFYPTPSVDSAVININLYPKPVIPAPYTDIFFRLIKAGFNQKRKALRNSLSAGLSKPKPEVDGILQQCDIDPKRRPQTLSLDEWKVLSYRMYHE